jgi:lipopolysaccharide export system protein LptC
MRPGRREVLLGVLLMAVGVGAYWLQSASRPGPPSSAGGDRRADYVVEGLRTVIMDAHGRPARRLWAERLRHYPDDGSMELERPRLELPRADGPPWRAAAASGWLNRDGDEVLLERRVRLYRAATDSAPPMLLRTSELLVLPRQDYAETGRFAEIETGRDWLTAQQGLRLWYGNERRVKLYGRLRARFASTPRANPNDHQSQTPIGPQP